MKATDPSAAKVYIAYGLALTFAALAVVTTLTDAQISKAWLWPMAFLIAGLLGADILANR